VYEAIAVFDAAAIDASVRAFEQRIGQFGSPVFCGAETGPF
jgi:hypothetical protein